MTKKKKEKKVFTIKDQVAFNRKALFYTMLLVLLGLVIYLSYHLYHSFQYDKLILYYADSHYEKLKEEEYSIKSHVTLDDKLVTVIELLSTGPLNHHSKVILSNRVKVINIWYLEGRLLINLSEDFYQTSHPKLLVHSIVASYFSSFSQIKEIQIFVENQPLKTILGFNNFKKTFNRESYWNKYSSSFG